MSASSSIAGESFTQYFIGRNLGGRAARAPSPADISSVARPVLPTLPAHCSARSGELNRLAGIHRATVLTPAMLLHSRAVVPGVDFEVRFSGSLEIGLQLFALADIQPGSLITEYGGERCDVSDFCDGRSRTHTIRLGTSTSACIDGLRVSAQAMSEIFVSGGFILPVDSPLYEVGVAALANAPSSPCGRGGPKAGRPNSAFFFLVSPGEMTPRCWLCAGDSLISAGDEIVVSYAWAGTSRTG